MTDTTANTPETSSDETEGLPTARQQQVADDFRVDMPAFVQRNRPMHTYAQAHPQREGVLATAKGGLHDPNFIKGQIGPESIVTINGQEMPIRQAERLGFVMRDANGEYRDARLAKGAQPKQDAEGEPEGDPEGSDGEQEDAPATLPEADEKQLDSMLRLAMDHGANPIHLAAEFLARPDRLPALAETIARKNGIDPRQLKADIDRVGAEFNKLAARVAAAEGVSYDDVLRYEAHHVDRAAQQRGRLLAFRGDLSYFRGLAVKCRNQSAPTRQSLPQGVTMREARDPSDNSKVTLVKVPGYREMRIETARRMRLI